MFDNAIEVTLFDTTYELVLLASPLGIAITVAAVLVAVMATLALTLPGYYQRFFVPVLWFAFAVAAAGSAFCWGMSGGIVEGFETSRDLNAALTIHDLAAEWRLSSLWFSLGFLVFCVLHVLFAYVARWAWLRKSEKREAAPDTPQESATLPPSVAATPRAEVR
jgi:hypothetical protein